MIQGKIAAILGQFKQENLISIYLKMVRKREKVKRKITKSKGLIKYFQVKHLRGRVLTPILKYFKVLKKVKKLSLAYQKKNKLRIKPSCLQKVPQSMRKHRKMSKINQKKSHNNLNLKSKILGRSIPVNKNHFK